MLQSFLVIDPSYPNPGPLGPCLRTSCSSTRRSASPIRCNTALRIERQLAKRTTLAVTYYGSLGVDLFRSRDINAPLRFHGAAMFPTPRWELCARSNPLAAKSGNSLEITLRGDLGRYFTGLAQYTLSRTDNNTGGINWFPANQYDLSSGEWGRADFDQRHRFNMLESFKPGKRSPSGWVLRWPPASPTA